VVRYVDKQCAYIEGLMQENGETDAVQGGPAGSTFVTSGQPTMVDLLVTTLSGAGAVKSESLPRGSVSTCSDFSLPSTPRRNSLESYSDHVAEYEAELSQPYAELLMVLVTTKFAAQKFDAFVVP